MIIIDVIRANKEISRLNKELADLKANTNAIASSSKEIVKESFKMELANLRSEYELKIADKDREINAIKEASLKELEAVKNSVVEESIRLVASQGTNVVIETNIDAPLTKEQALAHFKKLDGKAAQEFYRNNSHLLIGS